MPHSHVPHSFASPLARKLVISHSFLTAQRSALCKNLVVVRWAPACHDVLGFASAYRRARAQSFELRDPSSSEACGGTARPRRSTALRSQARQAQPERELGSASGRLRTESSSRESPQASEGAFAATELGLTQLPTRPARSRRSRPRTALATAEKRTVLK